MFVSSNDLLHLISHRNRDDKTSSSDSLNTADAALESSVGHPLSLS